MIQNYSKNALLLVFFLLQIISGQAQTIAWQPKQQLGDDVPSRYGAGMTSLNGKLYITGGYSAGGSGHIHDFVEYDPATGIVRNLASPSTSNPTSNILLTVNGKIYHYIAPFFLEYDFATNAWFPKAWNTTVTTTLEGAAFVIGNEIYLLSETNNNVSAYNVVTDTWTTKAAYPGNVRRAAVSLSVNGKGYFGGGTSYATNNCYSSDAGCFLQDFHEYDPIANTWTPKAQLPKPLKNVAAFGHNTKGYVGLGHTFQTPGFNFGHVSSYWYEYDPATNTWVTKSFPPLYSIAPSVAKINDDIYVFGGRGGANVHTSQSFNFLIKYNVPSNTWTVNETIAGGNRLYGAGFYANNKIYYGGGHDGQLLGDFWEYDIVSNTWTVKAPFPDLFAQRAAVALNGKGYFVGGYYKDVGVYSDALVEYDPSTNTWTIKALFPGGERGNMAAFELNGKVYAGLGFDGTNTNKNDFYMYDPATNVWVAKANVPLFSPTNGQHTSAFTIGNTGYILQHQDAQGTGAKLYAYDPVANTWSIKAPQPLINNQPGVNQAFVLNGKAYVFSFNKIYEYDPVTNAWRLAGNAPFMKEGGYVIGTPIEGFMGFGRKSNTVGSVKVTNDWWRMCMGTSSTITANSCDSYSLNGQTYTTSGTYTQTRPNTAGCDSIITLNLTINPKPASPTLPATITYCQNEAANQLTATGTALLWYSSATGGTGSATAPVPSTATPGTTSYYVTQTVNGCESSRASITVTINSKPAIPVVGGYPILCQGQPSGPLFATGTGLLWYTAPTGGTGTATAPTPSTVNAGTLNYYVSQTVNGCESDRSLLAVQVDPKPATPVISQNGGVLTASGAGHFQWFLNGSLISGANSYSYNTTANGIYTVMVSVNYCPSDISAAVNVTNTGIANALADKRVEVYPNPASGSFNVKLTGYLKGATVILFNLAGQQLTVEKVSAESQAKIVDIMGLATGTYLLKVTTEEGVQVSRLIVR